MKALEAVRFLLELCAVAALVIGGAALGWWLAAGLPVALVVVWGWLIAPRSTRRLPDPQRLVLEIAIFIAAGTALAISGYPILGILLAFAAIVVAAALRLTDSHI